MEEQHSSSGAGTTNMAAAPPRTTPNSIFDAIAERNHDGMIGMYASNAREALLSYVNVQNRWNSSTSVGGEPRAEEKLDEFFQHLSYRESNNHHHHQSMGSSSSFGVSSPPPSPSLSPRRSNRGRPQPSSNSKQSHPMWMASSQEEEFHNMFAELSDILNSVATTTNNNNNNNNNMKQSLSGSSLVEHKQSYPVKKTTKLSSFPTTKKTFRKTHQPQTPTTDQIDRLGWESATILSNSRPPSSFVVYSKDHQQRQQDDNDNHSDDDESMNDTTDATPTEHTTTTATTPTLSSPPPPPLFDGAVANATPPAFTITANQTSTATTTTSAGGTGTSLHLACAIDSPFALAILLVMGGDAAAPHTAFRRMILHEAACNGALQCLKVLLELGTQCRKTMTANHQQTHNNSATSSCLNLRSSSKTTNATVSASSCERPTTRFAKPSIFFPYLSNSSNTKGEEDHHHHHNNHVDDDDDVTLGKDKAVASGKSSSTHEEEDEETEEDLSSFVSNLRKILNLSQKIQTGQLSEYQAAMSLLSYKHPEQQLLDTTVMALSKSCTFVDSTTTDSANTSSLPLKQRQPQQQPNPPMRSKLHGYSDGHGNTPLHWAAFKNETGCVSELLKYSANPNARAHPSGWTPLHDGAYSNAAEAVALLLKAGADVDALANSGATPLCFAAQEDAFGATQILLHHNADLTARCCGHPLQQSPQQQQQQHHHHHHGRFSGYTPLHYCAHYNAHRAARVLLGHRTAKEAMEIPDLNDRLPIHVAVARGSSDVLRELLHNGARVDTPGTFANGGSSPPSSSPRPTSPPTNIHTTTTTSFSGTVRRGYAQGRGGRVSSPPSSATSSPRPERPAQYHRYSSRQQPQQPQPQQLVAPRTPPSGRARGIQQQQQHYHSPNRSMHSPGASSTSSTNSSTGTGTPVSSPVLRSMIPSRPITSSKPWNCLSQRSIDNCRALITEVEQNWTPTRHSLFTPVDRRAVVELLRVGKRLEQVGTGIYILDLWPLILSFCGRGWFETQPTQLEELEQLEQQQQQQQQGQSQNYPPTGLIGAASAATTTQLLQHDGIQDIITSNRSEDDQDDEIMELDRSVTPPPSFY